MADNPPKPELVPNVEAAADGAPKAGFAPCGTAAGAVPNGDEGAPSGAPSGAAAKADAGAEAAVPKAEAGAAAGAPNDGVVAAAGGADAGEAGSTLAVGAPKRPAEGVGLKGDAAGANGTVVAGIVEACRLSAAGFEEAAGVGVVLASADFETAGASDVVVT